MWHGGTNFERDAMFLQTTSYDCDAALDEYGLPTDKAEHLRLMHDCLRGHAEFLLEGAVQAPEVLVPGRLPQHADGVVLHAFRRGARELAIVVNGNDWPKRVTARGLTLDLPNHGAAVLAGDRRRHALVYRSWVGPEVRVQRRMLPAGKTLRWQMAADPLPGTEPCRPLAFRPVKLPHNMLLATRDETDYGWYRTEFVAARGGTARLAVTVADLLSVWVNGVYAGTVPERLEEERQKAAPPPCSLDVTLERGRNTLLLLADAIGMIKGDWMIDAPQSRERKGLLSKVTLDGRPVAGPWEFAGGLWGEGHRRFDPVTDSGPAWGAPTLAGGPLRWYRAGFRVTAAELAQPAPWAVEVGGLCKGFIWVNGRGIGRYWQLPARDARRARYGNHPHLLNTGHDQPVQRYYHIPADWLREGGNHLVVLEERGALPRGARLVRRH